MNSVSRKLILLMIPLLSLACGSNPGTSTAYDGNSSNCSSVFVDDYNFTIDAFSSATYTSPLDVKLANDRLSQFTSRYQDVNCKADYMVQKTMGDQSVWINVNSKTSFWTQQLADPTKASRFPEDYINLHIDPVSCDPSTSCLSSVSYCCT